MLQGSGPILPNPSNIGALGLLALNQSLTSDKVKNNIALGTARAKGLNNPFIPEDPILSPDSIQKDLNALTSDLKNVKSQKPKKQELVNEKEIKEFDDVDDFKSWIKENTATDATTGDLFYVSVKGEKIPLEDSPETNVLLYELFKQDVGRGGEALETIKDLNIQQFQQAPASAKFSDKNPFDDRFNKELEKARDTIGTPKSSNLAPS